MTTALTDAQIEAAIEMTLVAPTQRVADEWRARLKAARPHLTGHVTLQAATVAELVENTDWYRAVVAELAMETRAFRSNYDLFHSIPPAPRGYCSSCRCSAPLASMMGSDKPVQQAMALDRLACRLSPPVLRAVGPGPIITSVFPPVHPDQGCDQWQARDDVQGVDASAREPNA